MYVQVLSRSTESKGEGSDVMVIESGRVSGLVHQFDESDGPSQVRGWMEASIIT